MSEHLVISAIQNQLKIRFYYDGGFRIVEPHTVGYSRNGYILLRGFQVSGYSRSGNSNGWKLFRLDESQNQSICDEKFEARPGYKMNDSHIPHILAQLKIKN